MMRRVNIFCSFALLFASHTSLAVTYPLPPEGSRLVGQSFTVTVPDHNTQPLETAEHSARICETRGEFARICSCGPR